MCYPLIVRVNCNPNNPSTRKASKVWILKLWETQASGLATPTESASQTANQTCQGRPSSPVQTLSMESGPLKPSCLEIGYSKWTGEKSLLRGTPRENKTGEA